MKVINIVGDELVLSVAAATCSRLVSGLSMARSYCQPPVDDADREMVTSFISAIEAVSGECEAIAPLVDDPDAAFQIIDGDSAGNVVVAITRENLKRLATVFGGLVNGFSIWEWEFYTLVGYHRAELRDVFNALHLILLTSKSDLLEQRER